jgi:hypothetical protein
VTLSICPTGEKTVTYADWRAVRLAANGLFGKAMPADRETFDKELRFGLEQKVKELIEVVLEHGYQVQITFDGSWALDKVKDV